MQILCTVTIEQKLLSKRGINYASNYEAFPHTKFIFLLYLHTLIFRCSNIKTSAKESLGLHELKQHKPWFDEECLQFLDERKQAKLQQVQDPSQRNVDNLNNVRREASRHFRNKKKAYLKAKIEDLETNSKIKNIRDLYRSISEFKNGYQPRTNIVNDETGDLVTGSYSILAGWRDCFSHLLNVRQTETHTAEPLVPQPSAFEIDLAIEKLKSHKSPGTDHIPAELIKEVGRTIHYQVHKLTVSIWNEEELPEEWKESIIVPIHKKEDKTDCNNYRGISRLPTTYNILSNILLSRLTPYAEEIIGDHQCGF